MKPTGLQAMISNKMFGKKKKAPASGKKPMVKTPVQTASNPNMMPPKGIAVGNSNAMRT